MALAVVSVASGGLPVVQLAGATGLPVTESANARGIAVTKVAGNGLPVTYVTEAGVIVPPAAVAWNPSDKTANVTLTGSNLTATCSGNGGVRATTSKSTGKWYFEVKMTVWLGANSGPGLALASVTLPWFNVTAGVVYVDGFGNIRINGSTSGSTLGTPASNDVIGCAIDLDADVISFRKAPIGNWNGSGTANPATGVGALSIAAISGALFPGVMFQQNTEAAVAAFVAGSLVGTVPSGFTAGWG